MLTPRCVVARFRREPLRALTACAGPGYLRSVLRTRGGVAHPSNSGWGCAHTPPNGFCMIFTPAAPSSTESLCSDGIWSARGVGDFTDELFEDVFEGNQAARLAVFVDQASEV